MAPVTGSCNSSSKSKSKKQPLYMKRLHEDLKHLKEEPILGANAEPLELEHNMLKWYGIVLGPEGTKYAGRAIRFILEFSNEYPNKPPKAYFETHIEYEGTTAPYKDESGRIVVCLSIFGNLGKIHTEWVSKSDGWSPSYTVRTILTSMQALLLSNMLSTNKQSIKHTRKSALDYICPKTRHLGSVTCTWFPKVITDYNLVAAVAAKHGRVGVKVLRDFYVCYMNKSTADDPSTTIGYGIHVENNGTFSSPCEYLSRSAYTNCTRRGSKNQPFEYWIPILITGPYSGKFMEQLNRALETITAANSRLFPRDTPPYARLFKLCSSVMNNLVVEIKKNHDDITANDKLINGYVAFYRLLISYAEVDSRMVRYCNKAIREFLASPANRVKKVVSNLGELLIHLTIADEYDWNDLADAFMEESDARNVKWCLDTAYGSELGDEKFLRGRSKQVLHLTRGSRKLIMYQVRFSEIVKTLTPAVLNSNYGLAPDDIRDELNNICDMVRTGTWDAFFAWVRMPLVPDDVRDRQLFAALKWSKEVGYHGRIFGNNNDRSKNGNGSGGSVSSNSSSSTGQSNGWK